MGILMCSKLGISRAAAKLTKLIPAAAEVNNAEMKAAARNVFLFGGID
jgi:hypothetical protein